MTTRQILMDTADHIEDLIPGYAVKFFRWTDADKPTVQNDANDFVMLRFPSGGGISDPLLQQFDVLIVMVKDQPASDPGSVVAGHDDMSAILRRMRQGGSQNTVLRFEPLQTNFSGPMYLDNGRPVWTLDVRCYTEGY